MWNYRKNYKWIEKRAEFANEQKNQRLIEELALNKNKVCYIFGLKF